MTVLNKTINNHTTAKMFFDEPLGMQRFDTLKYRALINLLINNLDFLETRRSRYFT
jgi:hypothetical protein